MNRYFLVDYHTPEGISKTKYMYLLGSDSWLNSVVTSYIVDSINGEVTAISEVAKDGASIIGRIYMRKDKKQ